MSCKSHGQDATAERAGSESPEAASRSCEPRDQPESVAWEHSSCP